MKVIAIIGCGRIANKHHLPNLTKIDEIRIKYACDLIEEKAVKAKSDFPKIENVITDYKVALSDPEVDAVYVLTPNFAHYTVTMDALKAGKHVFCEKPITVNYELSVKMAQEAEKVGSFAEFTENILPRIALSNYNTIQLMAIMSHPYYGSFG